MIARAKRSLFRYHRSRMGKRSAPKPPAPRAPAPRQAQGPRAFALNPNVNRQTRKMLAKHYRAKYGVK